MNHSHIQQLLTIVVGYQIAFYSMNLDLNVEISKSAHYINQENDHLERDENKSESCQ